MIPPRLRYLATEDGHLAWQSWGEGPNPLLDCGLGTMFGIEEVSEEPRWLRYVRRLASFSRLLRFDPPGVGGSDPPRARTPDVQVAADAALAVLDAAEVQRADVLAAGWQAMVAALLVAQHPERVSRLVLVNPLARFAWAADHPYGVPQATVDGWLAGLDPRGAAAATPAPEDDASRDVFTLAAGAAGDPAFRSWWERAARRGASPSVAVAYNRSAFRADARPLLAGVGVPALVVQRDALPAFGAAHGRGVADTIPGAHYVELPGVDYVSFLGDAPALLDEVEEFLTGDRYGGEVQRVFAVVLFTDIVGSTALAVQLGDARWRSLLLDHGTLVARELSRWGGRLVQDLGDGTLSTFPSPGRAVRCAVALRDAAEHLGVHLRAGLHAGEVELRGDDIAGINVHTAARVVALAGEGEVLVSGTVAELVAGSSLAFEDRGVHELRGVPGRRQVWAVAAR